MLPMVPEKQGIVHMVGPETGRTQPGKFIACGDSPYSNSWSFGAIAFGIGTSEVKHVFATQTIWQVKPKKMLVGIHWRFLKRGLCQRFHSSLDCQVRRRLWCWLRGGGVSEVRLLMPLSMEERMTICNMSIEFGSKMGIMNPDAPMTILRARVHSKGFDAAVTDWKGLLATTMLFMTTGFEWMSWISTYGDLGNQSTLLNRLLILILVSQK